nr:MAG: hypothetical protein [Bee densovirus 5]
MLSDISAWDPTFFEPLKATLEEEWVSTTSTSDIQDSQISTTLTRWRLEFVRSKTLSDRQKSLTTGSSADTSNLDSTTSTSSTCASSSASKQENASAERSKKRRRKDSSESDESSDQSEDDTSDKCCYIYKKKDGKSTKSILPMKPSRKQLLMSVTLKELVNDTSSVKHEIVIPVRKMDPEYIWQQNLMKSTKERILGNEKHRVEKNTVQKSWANSWSKRSKK